MAGMRCSQQVENFISTISKIVEEAVIVIGLRIEAMNLEILLNDILLTLGMSFMP